MRTLALIMILSLQSASAQQLADGAPLTAADLAKQLDIKNWSIIYKTGHSIRQISLDLIYRSRASVKDDFTEKHLNGVASEFREALDQVNLVILVDSRKSTIILPGGSSSGTGFTQHTSSLTTSLPQINDQGRYILYTDYFDSKSGTDPKNIMSTLELSITSK